jgi:alanine dehydrogenase
VLVERGAGSGIDFLDSDYMAAGADIVDSAEEIFKRSEMIVKVKEPQLHECGWLGEGQILFTYLHLAADRRQAEALMYSGATCIAYETVTDDDGGLPLLRPMSEVAGRMSVQIGAHYLEKAQGGRGVLLGGVPGVAPGKVVILGGGVSGVHAAQMALGLRAEVTILDISAARLAAVDDKFGGRVKTIVASDATIRAGVSEADLVIGAVLIPGGAAPKLVTREMLATMKRGAVLVDISIDQGGCFETSRVTTHEEPVFVDEGVVHYCVANIPGAVARTSTIALNNVTLPFVILLAEQGAAPAMAANVNLRRGLNVAGGAIRHDAVAHALGVM